MEVGSGVNRAQAVARAHAELAAGRNVLCYGPAGIGRSSLLRAVRDLVRSPEHAQPGPPPLVLQAAPAAADAELPYLTLIDLLSAVDHQLVQQLPAPQRAALDAALLRSDLPVGRSERLAVRVAALNLLRALAATRPVLIILDDLQWIDPLSAEVLVFLSRRLSGLPIQVLAAERTPVQQGVEPHHHGLCPEPLLPLRVPPLTPAEVARLLRGLRPDRLTAEHEEDQAETATPFDRYTVETVHQATGGNPLYALEVGQALLRRGGTLLPGQPLPIPARLRALIERPLDGLSPEARQALLLAAAAAPHGRPPRRLLDRNSPEQAVTGLSEAADRGIAEIDPEGLVRFGDPLLPAALYAAATTAERRAAHASLAEASTEPIERARHLALATPGDDESIAADLTAAADTADHRGDRATAAELLLLAAERTPDDRGTQATQRRLAGATAALAAGQWETARRAADQVLRSPVDAGRRVQAELVRADAGDRAPLDQVLATAGDDPALQAPVLLRLAQRTHAEHSWSQAAAEAAQAAAAAAAAQSGAGPSTAGEGTATTLVRALALQARCESGLGNPGAAQTYSQVVNHVDEQSLAGWEARRLRAQFQLYADRAGEAGPDLVALAAEAADQGRLEEEVATLVLLTEAQVRAGRCRQALESGARALVLVEEAGIGLGAGRYAAALSEAAGGDLDRARALARQGARDCAAGQDRIGQIQNLAVLGRATLTAGDPRAALEPLRTALELEQGLGVTDPAVFGFHPDLAEALLASGDQRGAVRVLESAGQQARRLGRRSLQAALERVAVLARSGEPARPGWDGRGQLRNAARLQRATPVERGRTLLALGTLERRGRQRAAARAAFDEAYQVFQGCGARPWSDRARDEAVRAGGVVAAGPVRTRRGVRAEVTEGPLTDTEQRVARLVADGATNREVAARLFLSVKTVEANLTRVYRKLAVRSRTELAGLLRSRPT